MSPSACGLWGRSPQGLPPSAPGPSLSRPASSRLLPGGRETGLGVPPCDARPPQCSRNPQDGAARQPSRVTVAARRGDRGPGRETRPACRRVKRGGRPGGGDGGPTTQPSVLSSPRPSRPSRLLWAGAPGHGDQEPTHAVTPHVGDTKVSSHWCPPAPSRRPLLQLCPTPAARLGAEPPLSPLGVAGSLHLLVLPHPCRPSGAPRCAHTPAPPPRLSAHKGVGSRRAGSRSQCPEMTPITPGARGGPSLDGTGQSGHGARATGMTPREAVSGRGWWPYSHSLLTRRSSTRLCFCSDLGTGPGCAPPSAGDRVGGGPRWAACPREFCSPPQTSPGAPGEGSPSSSPAARTPRPAGLSPSPLWRPRWCRTHRDRWSASPVPRHLCWLVPCQGDAPWSGL